MKIQFLGTAAAEGIPGLFCNCENCIKSRAAGNRAFRTRSQALIDDTLLIDFPADTYMHTLAYNIDMANIRHCLITHNHQDHLYPEDIRMLNPRFCKMPDDYHLTFYGTEQVEESIRTMLAPNSALQGVCGVTKIHPFAGISIGAYMITPLPAIHDPSSGPVFYQISDRRKTVLYAHDTHYFHDSIWEFWAKEKPYFSLVSLDCTNACLPLRYIGHMGLAENIQVRNRMLKEGYADERTVFICNHFSHNGTNVVYDDFVPIALREGFLTSYDGMEMIV